MLTRLRQNPEAAEKIAARQIVELAEWIQNVCYYCDDEDHTLPRETAKELHHVYRVLKQYTVFFRGYEHGLCWDAPTGRFQKKDSK